MSMIRIAHNRRVIPKRVPTTPEGTRATTKVTTIARKTTKEQARTHQRTLTHSRTAVIASATSSAPATGAAKVNQTVNKTPSGPSLYERVCTTRNLKIGGIVIGSAAVAAAFGVLATKVGTLAASQIVATSTVAFLTPGVTIFGFALKTGMFITLNTVVPVMSGLVTIALPFISTAVVATIAVFVTLHLVNKMIQQMKDSMNSGLTTMKDTVTGLPGTLLKQVPGHSFVTSLFSSGEAPLSEEQEFEARQKRQRDEIERANRESGSLQYFETLGDEKTVALLKGERSLIQSNSTDRSAPKGLAILLEEGNTHEKRPAGLSRVNRLQKTSRATGEVA